MEEKNKIKICSDPYKKNVFYFWHEENGEWKDMSEKDESPLNTVSLRHKPISHMAYDLFRTLIDEKIYNSSCGLDIVFEGTDDDFADLCSVRDLYYSDKDIFIERGTSKMPLAKDVMPCIEESYEKLKKYFKDYPDADTEDILNRYTDAVKPEIALCVMGLYSSGKSAFINAIVGKEILPSESDPATAKIYKIRESKESRVVFKYKNEECQIVFKGSKWKVNTNPNSEIIKIISESIEKNSPKTEDQYLYWTLFALNTFAKEEGKNKHAKLLKCSEKLLNSNELKNSSEVERIELLLKKYRIRELINNGEIENNQLDDVIEVYTNFEHSFLPLDKFQFVIYDTPGSNSVMFREHADILKDSLEQQTNGLPIYITNPDTMDDTDNNGIMDSINELGDALDLSCMMLVVNKSDEKSKGTLLKKIENRDNLVVTKWKASRVYFVSSIIGLGGKKKNPDDESNWIDDDYCLIYSEKLNRFCDENDKQYMKLYEYNILPTNEKERLLKLVEEEQGKELLLWNSGIPCVEAEIGMFASKYALYNKCAQAIQYLVDASMRVYDKVDEIKEDANKTRADIQMNLDEKKKSLIDQLNNECKAKKTEFTNEFVDFISKDSVSKYLDSSRIAEVINNSINSAPGKNDHEKLERFNALIEEELKKDIKNYSKETSRHINKFWKDKSNVLRESLMKIVVGSSALTKEQKDALKEVVLNASAIPEYHTKLNIKDTTAIKHKDSRFLWFLWYMTKIDREEAKMRYKKSLGDDISRNNKKAIEDNGKNFSDWLNLLNNEITSAVSAFNPELSALTAKLEEQKEIIRSKTKQANFISEQINTIDSLISFLEV